MAERAETQECARATPWLNLPRAGELAAANAFFGLPRAEAGVQKTIAEHGETLREISLSTLAAGHDFRPTLHSTQ